MSGGTTFNVALRLLVERAHTGDNNEKTRARHRSAAAPRLTLEIFGRAAALANFLQRPLRRLQTALGAHFYITFFYVVLFFKHTWIASARL